jgi:hypothetical protein
VPDAPTEIAISAQCDKGARKARRRSGQFRLGHRCAGDVRGKSLAGNSEELLAIGVACHDSVVRSAGQA